MMIPRLLLAVIGAAAITTGLLLLMDDVTNRYSLRDPTRYFRITDYFPAPDHGRQLPDIPILPEMLPDRPEFEYMEEGEQPGGEWLPWEPLPEKAAPHLEEQLILGERQTALSADSARMGWPVSAYAGPAPRC